jgi:hypothetical protein
MVSLDALARESGAFPMVAMDQGDCRAEVLEALGQLSAEPSRTNGRPRDLGELVAVQGPGVAAATGFSFVERFE